LNIEDHINFWITSADSDLDTAEKLLLAEKYEWCLFLGHLVLEKVLKAHYVKDNENRIPPRIHNLVKLAENTRIEMDESLKLFFNEVTDFNIEVRYPDYKFDFQKKCNKDFCLKKFSKIKEKFQCLKSQILSEK
jgi:HEPN domain-containing protein